MSLPEISRRCLSCGAAVRAGARFCPQCGKSVNDESPVAQEGFGGRVVIAEPRESEGDSLSRPGEIGQIDLWIANRSSFVIHRVTKDNGLAGEHPLEVTR